MTSVLLAAAFLAVSLAVLRRTARNGENLRARRGGSEEVPT